MTTNIISPRGILELWFSMTAELENKSVMISFWMIKVYSHVAYLATAYTFIRWSRRLMMHILFTFKKHVNSFFSLLLRSHYPFLSSYVVYHSGLDSRIVLTGCNSTSFLFEVLTNFPSSLCWALDSWLSAACLGLVNSIPSSSSVLHYLYLSSFPFEYL